MPPETLSVADQSELLVSLIRMRLLAPGEQTPLTPLTGGVSSLIVRAETPGGALCVKRALAQLKVAAVWEAPVERNRAEVAWMKVAGAIVPDAVPAILGEDPEACAFAMAWLEPADYPVWKSQLLAGTALPATARAVAHNLVAIHAATADNAELARQFANDDNFYALRLEPYFMATAKRHPECADALHQLVKVTADKRRVLVHGDISPKNILIGPKGPVFLDAECAWYGDPAFDLAFCLNHLLLKCVWRPESAPDYLACYDLLAATYLQGVNWEPLAELEARTTALLAGMLLARIDGKSPVEYITQEGDRERVRQFAVPLLLQPPDSLQALRQRWSQNA